MPRPSLIVQTPRLRGYGGAGDLRRVEPLQRVNPTEHLPPGSIGWAAYHDALVGGKQGSGNKTGRNLARGAEGGPVAPGPPRLAELKSSSACRMSTCRRRVGPPGHFRLVRWRG